VEILRLILFLGLVFHKVLWEIMKRRESLGITPQPFKWSFKSLVKFFKMMVLVFLVVQTLFLDLLPIVDRPIGLRVMGTTIYFVGLAMALTARLQLGKHWANIEDCQVISGQSLITSGIYRYIRHPIYAGDITLLVGLELALNSWLVLGIFILLLFVIRQALAEEALLSQVFPEYRAYCSRTKRFIPFIV
jgi:protein-S-isoprenylcysteine O-methyltransferase Ste14